MEGVEGQGGSGVSGKEGIAAGGKMTQALYAHMNNKTIKHKREKKRSGMFSNSNKIISKVKLSKISQC
jgi:hypothetical protein